MKSIHYILAQLIVVNDSTNSLTHQELMDQLHHLAVDALAHLKAVRRTHALAVNINDVPCV